MPNLHRGGIRIHYEIRGSGPALLMHTGAGGDLRMWELAGYVEGLPGFRKILMDQRGRGESDRPTRMEDHRMECFTQDVAAVLDDAKVEAAGFWGYSNGALVGIAFGAAYPKRLKALVGTGSLPYVDYTELPRPEDPDAEVRKIVARGGVVHSLEGFMKRDEDRFPAAIDRNVRSGDPLMNALDDIAWLSWAGPKNEYARVRAPVLMITGEREDSTHQTEKSVAALPKARVERLPGQGHLAAFYRSELALPVAIPFLEEHLREG